MGWRFYWVLVFFISLGDRADAYPTPVDFDGSLLRWEIGPEDAPITYEMKADHASDLDTFDEVIRTAAELWSSAPGSYFRFEALTAEAKAQVTINLKRQLDGGSYSAGYAIFDEYENAKPAHCSIFVGVTSDQSYAAISKTILHELGHCVGLGHTLVAEAIMSYRLDQNGFSLDVDDHAAVARLYPKSGAKPATPPGCSITSNELHVGFPVLLFCLPVLLCGVWMQVRSLQTAKSSERPTSDRLKASP